MNVAVAARARDNHLRLIVVLAILAAALLWFVVQKLHYVTDYSLASYSEYFWSRRAGLIFHLLGGLLAIGAGLVQIWLGLTNRTGTLHRSLGKVYAAGVLVGSIGAFYLAFTIPGHHLPYSAGLFTLAVAWLLTTGMALYSIRARRIEQHREWMLRSYTVTFAFVTYRLVAAGLRSVLHMPESQDIDDVDLLMAWACWAVPLLVAEVLIQVRSVRRHAALQKSVPA